MSHSLNSRRFALAEALESRSLLSAVAFTIDSAQSQIAVSGNVSGLAFEQQGQGSLTAQYAGTINADVTSSTIQFTGGSSIDAQPSGNWLPGGTPADYGVTISSLGVNVAVRDQILDITSPVMPVSGGTFASTAETFPFTSGTVALDAGAFGTGSDSIAGQSLTNTSGNTSSVIASAGTLTLTLPVSGSVTVNDPQIGVPVLLQFTGQIVATGADPGDGGGGGGGGAGVQVSGITLTGTPARVIGGDKKAKATALVALNNSSTSAFAGPVTIALFLSDDANPDPGTDAQLASVTKNLKLKASAAGKPLKFKVQFPAVGADANFFVVAAATGTGVDTATDSASAGPVLVEKPVVNLIAAGSPPVTSFKLGKKAALAIPLQNTGNVAAKGVVNFDLLLSLDGTEATATPLATLPGKVAINPGAIKAVKLKASLPPAGAGVAPGTFFLLVRLNATAALADLNLSDGTLLPAVPVTLAP